MKLVIGNKNYSSWSLRPWLLLSANKVEFEEVVIPLLKADTHSRIAQYSQAGKVPVLKDGEVTIWDSLAICEYVSEVHLDGRGWPLDRTARAEARACSAEMHSGFFAIRNHLHMNFRALNRKVEINDEIQKEIQRIDQLWSQYRKKYHADGPWLFGRLSIADCMYAPVASRFKTYGVEVSAQSQEYIQTVFSHPCIKQWLLDSQSETEVIQQSEVG